MSILGDRMGYAESLYSKGEQKRQDIINKSMKSVGNRVVAMDKEIPRNYDIRWASLHSINAFGGSDPEYMNQEEYQKLVERYREIYLKRVADIKL